MSKSIIAAIVFAATALPEGVVAGNLEVTLYSTLSPELPVQPPANPTGDTVTFDNVPAGDYYAVTRRLDSNGNVLGSPVTSNTITVPADAATYDAPASITLSLG